MIARLGDHVDALAMAVVFQAAMDVVQQHVGKADNRVERSSQFVTDGAQETPHCYVVLLRSLACPIEFALQIDLLTGVSNEHDGVTHLTRCPDDFGLKRPEHLRQAVAPGDRQPKAEADLPVFRAGSDIAKRSQVVDLVGNVNAVAKGIGEEFAGRQRKHIG